MPSAANTGTHFVITLRNPASVQTKGVSNMSVPTLGLSVDQVAQATGLSVTWLNQLRCAKKGPAYLKVGHRVLYRPADVDSHG